MTKVDVLASCCLPLYNLGPSHELSTLFSQCGLRLLCVGLELILLTFFSHTSNSSELATSYYKLMGKSVWI